MIFSRAKSYAKRTVAIVLVLFLAFSFITPSFAATENKTDSSASLKKSALTIYVAAIKKADKEYQKNYQSVVAKYNSGLKKAANKKAKSAVTKAYKDGLKAVKDKMQVAKKKAEKDLKIANKAIAKKTMKPETNTKSTPANLAEKDCGVAGTVTTGSSGKAEAENYTIKAWECFTDALKICAKSSLGSNAPGMEQYGFKIIGKQDNLCMVSGPKFNFETLKIITQTCGYSQKYIDSSYDYAETKYPGKKFMKAGEVFANIPAGGGEIPYPDSTKETIVCK